jgi:hypothetical protein
VKKIYPYFLILAAISLVPMCLGFLIQFLNPDCMLGDLKSGSSPCMMMGVDVGGRFFDNLAILSFYSFPIQFIFVLIVALKVVTKTAKYSVRIYEGLLKEKPCL